MLLRRKEDSRARVRSTSFSRQGQTRFFRSFRLARGFGLDLWGRFVSHRSDQAHPSERSQILGTRVAVMIAKLFRSTEVIKPEGDQCNRAAGRKRGANETDGVLSQIVKEPNPAPNRFARCHLVSRPPFSSFAKSASLASTQFCFLELTSHR